MGIAATGEVGLESVLVFALMCRSACWPSEMHRRTVPPPRDPTPDEKLKLRLRSRSQTSKAELPQEEKRCSAFPREQRNINEEQWVTAAQSG